MSGRRPVNPWLGLTGLGLLLFVVAEVAALIWVSSEIGWWTILIMVATSVLGVFLLNREWKKAWGALAESLRSGQLPSGQMADATLILLGGVFLVLPGLLSDVVGAVLLLPFTRPFVRAAVSWWATRTLQRSGAAPVVIKGEASDEPEPMIPGIVNRPGPEAADEGEVIEGTIVEGTVIDPDDPRH